MLRFPATRVGLSRAALRSIGAWGKSGSGGCRIIVDIRCTAVAPQVLSNFSTDRVNFHSEKWMLIQISWVHIYIYVSVKVDTMNQCTELSFC